MDSILIIKNIVERMSDEGVCFIKCQSDQRCFGRTKEGVIKKLDSIFSSTEEYNFLFGDMFRKHLNKYPLVKRTVEIEDHIVQIALLSPILNIEGNAIIIRILK